MSMMEELIKKHVVLSMGNGHVLEGFVEEINNGYLKLIETNNQQVVVSVKDISFARLGGVPETTAHRDTTNFYKPPEPIMYKPIIEQDSKPEDREFSMSMPRPTDNPYVRQPELVRRSDK